MILAKKMITKLTKALGCDGYNIVQNNGEADGQTVFHYHVHMIPRHKDHKVGLGWTMHELTEEEKEEIVKMKEISRQTLEALSLEDETKSAEILARVSEGEKEIDEMQKKYLKRQIKRAKKGESKAECGIMFSEMLTDFERIGDYALNVAQLYDEMA